MDTRSRLLDWFGGTPWGVDHQAPDLPPGPAAVPAHRWAAGHPGHPRGPIVLLTTTGRRTGNQHTTPVFHLQDRERIIPCDVTPGGERANPWTLNLRAQPLAWVQLGAQVRTYRARPATETELERYWPQLVRV
jgi:F420H(2)-dependent quinone reductase